MKKAFLITYDYQESINEANALCEAAGYEVIFTIKQKFLKRPKYGVSEEIIDRVEEAAKRLSPDVIVYDEVLKPSQNYNLASKLHRNILDRESLILEIFENRASSAESHLQVKLAQMRYEMSRAKEKVRLAKMGEQPGFMGIGKFEADVYSNDIKHRMQSLIEKLEKSGKQRELHRESRKRQGFKTISLAGYTSAGKTTLFNRLTGETKEQSPELFTTLSTTTRKLIIDKQPFLISDTVGFISKLPAYMINAFKSTLEELNYTDVVVLVIDIHDLPHELKKKYQSCIRTLNEIGVDADRLIFALNKADLIPEDEVIRKAEELGLKENKKWLTISATSGKNIVQLRDLIKQVIIAQSPRETKNNTLRDNLDKIYGN